MPAPQPMPERRAIPWEPPSTLPALPAPTLGTISSLTLPRKEQQQIRDFCLGFPGGPGAGIFDLESLLKNVPQVVDRKLRYLISGGFAVDLASQTSRWHKDIDIVFTDRDVHFSGWYSFRIDKVSPEEYFAQMQLSNRLLASSARAAWTRPDGKGVKAYIVHPALVLIQKTSSFYGKAPRPKDIDDALTLARLATAEFPDQGNDWKKLLKVGLSSIEHERQPATGSLLQAVLRIAAVPKAIRADLLSGLNLGNPREEGDDLPPRPRL